MKMVVLFTIGDGCSYHCDETVPIVYDTKEQFLVDFETQCKVTEAKNSSHNWSEADEFKIGGSTFWASNFIMDGKYNAPDVLTIDEWFQQNIKE